MNEMTRDELQTLLDSHGADPAQWPAALRVAALSLIAGDPQARADHEAARALDAALTRFARPAAADETSAARVLTRLAGVLPGQDRGFWRRWPAVLLDWQFAPAWPRLAVLACCAVIGFGIGIAGLDRPFDRAGATAGNTDIASAVFEPEAITGARP
jgi:hypothetical protein